MTGRKNCGLLAIAFVCLCANTAGADPQLIRVDIADDTARLSVSDGADFHIVALIVDTVRSNGAITKVTLSVTPDADIVAGDSDNWILVYLHGHVYVSVSPKLSFAHLQSLGEHLLNGRGIENVRFVSETTFRGLLAQRDAAHPSVRPPAVQSVITPTLPEESAGGPESGNTGSSKPGVTFDGNTFDDADLACVAHVPLAGELTPQQASDAVSRLVGAYRELGFLEARIGTERLATDGGWATRFIVNEGHRYSAEEASAKTGNDVRANECKRHGDYFSTFSGACSAPAHCPFCGSPHVR